MTRRTAHISRATAETRIDLQLALEGNGAAHIRTGYGFADHLFTLMVFWAGFDCDLRCEGDLEVDAHHTVEDCALCFGQALDAALGKRAGIARVGNARVPMDEALASVDLDLSGRPWLEYRHADILPPVIAGEERALWREFFKSIAAAARMNLHVDFLYGENGHHLLESAGKGLGLALKNAVLLTRHDAIPSTKGSLD